MEKKTPQVSLMKISAASLCCCCCSKKKETKISSKKYLKKNIKPERRVRRPTPSRQHIVKFSDGFKMARSAARRCLASPSIAEHRRASPSIADIFRFRLKPRRSQGNETGSFFFQTKDINLKKNKYQQTPINHRLMGIKNKLR